MSKPRKVVIAVLLALVAIVATWLLVQVVYEARDRAVLARYQKELQTGMTRTVVDNYLKSHQIQYGIAYLGGSRGNAWSYSVKIRTQHSPLFLVCGQMWTFIVLDFDAPGRKEKHPAYENLGDPSDVLKDIRIVTAAECL
jgi:hypothetical protein